MNLSIFSVHIYLYIFIWNTNIIIWYASMIVEFVAFQGKSTETCASCLLDMCRACVGRYKATSLCSCHEHIHVESSSHSWTDSETQCLWIRADSMYRKDLSLRGYRYSTHSSLADSAINSIRANVPSKLCMRAQTVRWAHARKLEAHINISSNNVFAHISYTSLQIQMSPGPGKILHKRNLMKLSYLWKMRGYIDQNRIYWCYYSVICCQPKRIPQEQNVIIMSFSFIYIRFL